MSINPVTSIPFLGVHVAAATIFFIGFTKLTLAVAVFLYAIRMFAITAGYHRYFSHRSYKTGRIFQFCLGVLATSSAQMGPLWWAAHHRMHHRHSDSDKDIHSPVSHNFFWAHMGWILSDRYLQPDLAAVRDLTKYPELRLLDRYHAFVPALLGFSVLFFGFYIEHYQPQFQTSALQMLVGGFFVSTAILYHATFSINSLAHIWGNQEFATGDQSRNNFWLALITFGEGWHNNHHQNPHVEKQGIHWYQIDLTHSGLKFLEIFGLVWDLRQRKSCREGTLAL